jgi:hypothetical protein
MVVLAFDTTQGVVVELELAASALDFADREAWGAAQALPGQSENR